jgi:hypothetical protein
VDGNSVCRIYYLLRNHTFIVSFHNLDTFILVGGLDQSFYSDYIRRHLSVNVMGYTPRLDFTQRRSTKSRDTKKANNRR